ncbi:MAG: hypothetical protein HOW73_13190 [Polyangiaceae bacterium]|nr:hypothetical protein [Polyangiaceae bacterium]
MKAIVGLAGVLMMSLSCESSTPEPAHAPVAAKARVDVPLFSGLGTHSRKITTASPMAQKYFDQGLAFLYGFNHDEAIRAFRKAAEIDPKCAMAQWGIALANGPHINFPMLPPDRAKAAHEALARAKQHVANATDVERGLIDALSQRYHTPEPEDRKALDQAYADAMRALYRAHRDDADVGALFAEAMMDLRPWDLWTVDGKAQPGTEEIVTTLETILAKAPNHPLANHLHIHAVEASRSPERAVASADRLRSLQPALGHMVHMPSHIDVRLGHWDAAIKANEAAIAADARYAAQRPNQGFYRIYMAHNHHLLTFAAMMTGKQELAIRNIREMVAGVPPDWLKENASFADGYVAMPFEVLMRFGEWEEILAAPEPPSYLPLSRAIRRYARGVAYAATGDLDHARTEQRAFLQAKTMVSKGATFGNNAAADLLAIAEHVLDGEIQFREGHHEQGILQLFTAAALEDKLRYDEPPDWILPVRHALGAALLKADMPKEAEAVYRVDLAKLPNNVWSLHGLARSLRLQKKDTDARAVEADLAKASSGSDIHLTSSCMCLPGI